MDDSGPKSEASFKQILDDPRAVDRGEVRYGVDVAVTVDSDSNFYAGHATNLSSGGFFIATPIVHPVGTRFRFTIHLGKEQTLITGEGVVRWLRASKGSDSPIGLGIQFAQIDDDGERLIEEFLKQRKPLAPPDDA